MLVVTEPKVIYELGRRDLLNTNSIIFNMNANVSTFVPVYLMPPQGMIYTSLEFDNEYINLILTNDHYFLQLMRIMIPLRDGHDVYILAYNEETVFNPITETLMKLIQQRYGYNYQEIHSVDDLNIFDCSGFTTPGIIQFDEDFKRYEECIKRNNPYSYINEQINDSGRNHE